MKKFLISIIFLIAFAGVSSGLLLNSGFDGYSKMQQGAGTSYTYSIEETNSIDEMLSNSIYKTNYDEETQTMSNKDETDIVFDVVLFEFSDYPDYFNDKRKNTLYEYFNDNTADNSVYSVHEYFWDLSYHQVSIYANFYFYKDKLPMSDYDTPSQAIHEFATYTRALNSATELKVNYRKGNAYAMIFSGPKPYHSGTRLWAHAYPDFSYISLTYGHADVDVLYHEIFHTFMISDQYCYTSTAKTPVGNWDIISDEVGAVNTSLYNKKCAGWATVSDYSDTSEKTLIKEIHNTDLNTKGEDSLHLTLSATSDSSQNGVKAYKFGAKGQEYFMVEYRKSIRGGLDQYLPVNDCLVVYRVNEKYSRVGNVHSDYDTFEVYFWRPGDSTDEKYAYLIENGVCGGFCVDDNSLFYKDHSLAKFKIDNITFNGDGTASFDFYNLTDTHPISGIVRSSNQKLENMNIYLNGQLKATTDKNGEFVVLCENDGEQEIRIVDPNGNYQFIAFNVTPNEKTIKFYARETINTSIIIANGTHDNIYEVFKYEKDGTWTSVGSFRGDETFAFTGIETNSKYKINGYLVDNYEITFTAAGKRRIPQTKIEEEEKDWFDSAVDTIVSIPGQIADTLGDVYDGITDALGSIADGIGDLWGQFTSLF